jgi:hypothetical protein
MPKYLITAKIEVLQHATVEAETPADAMFWACQDYEADRSGRSRLRWSHAESFDPPSFMIEPHIVYDEDDLNDNDKIIADEEDDE